MILKDERVNGDVIRAMIVLAQMNPHIWHNESKYRIGSGNGNLRLNLGLKGIRNTAKINIQDILEKTGLKDYKIDFTAADFKDWQVSW